MRMLRSTLALGAVLALGLSACGTSTTPESPETPAPAEQTTAAAPAEEPDVEDDDGDNLI